LLGRVTEEDEDENQPEADANYIFFQTASRAAAWLLPLVAA
jgi:hypothetical protein